MDEPDAEFGELETRRFFPLWRWGLKRGGSTFDLRSSTFPPTERTGRIWAGPAARGFWAGWRHVCCCDRRHVEQVFIHSPPSDTGGFRSGEQRTHLYLHLR